MAEAGDSCERRMENLESAADRVTRRESLFSTSLSLTVIDETRDQPQLQPPLLLVSAAQLPRSASIEWQVTWQTGQVPWSPDEDESFSEEDDNPKPTKMRRIETNANELVGKSVKSHFVRDLRS